VNESGFRQFLKKSGKKSHVIDGLISHIRHFEIYLASKHHIELEAAGRQELQDYVETLDPGVVKKRMRGLALYYRFAGNSSLAELASSIREQEIAQTRQAFKLRKFRGVDLEAIAKLEAVGIVTAEHMLAAAKTPEAREQLSDQTGVALPIILELVKLSDLSRLGGIKAIRARLYYDAGLDTPEKFADWEPQALRQMLLEFVERTGFDGIAPLPKELQNTIKSAQQLPKVVQY